MTETAPARRGSPAGASRAGNAGARLSEASKPSAWTVPLGQAAALLARAEQAGPGETP
ncbi:hypothetical protein [Amycolatopsis sp. Poz14]|uniref:hypothetical protein n=1 Tax=Amycolatopsis sp. Poz14 TaxID=1447705 RepID=UPI001EE90993|nr:hypothetical protein [Amycolatopsis sp. Poz14]MCG3755986.1 hypothetical protein [Amycolatopsis sp. Poz14]